MSKPKQNNKENRCEKAGFEHSWYDITPNIVYTSNPPQYPPKQERCRNCGLERTHHERTERWVKYSDGKDRSHQWDDGTVTLIEGDITDSTSGSTTIEL